MSNSPRLGLPFLAEGQNNAHLTVNQSLTYLDALAQGVLEDRDLSTPPGGPSNGDSYLIKATGTGDWTGQDGKIAIYYSGWKFVTASEGMRFWLIDEDKYIRYDGSNWVEESPFVPGGIGLCLQTATWPSDSAVPVASVGTMGQPFTRANFKPDVNIAFLSSDLDNGINMALRHADIAGNKAAHFEGNSAHYDSHHLYENIFGGVQVGHTLFDNFAGGLAQCLSLKHTPGLVHLYRYSGTGSAHAETDSAIPDMSGSNKFWMFIFSLSDEANGNAIFRHYKMTGSNSRDMSGALVTDGITAVGNGTFTVDTDHAVNENTKEYLAVIFVDGERGHESVEIGEYTGNATDKTEDRFTLSRKGPQLMMINSSTTAARDLIVKSQQMGSEYSMKPTGWNKESNAILALTENGARLGTKAAVNTNLELYTYLSIRTSPMK